MTDNPILTPYPDLEANNIHSPDGLVNIFRVRIDACDRMWGLDTGVNDILGNFTVVRPMTLTVIDLKTDKVSFLDVCIPYFNYYNNLSINLIAIIQRKI